MTGATPSSRGGAIETPPASVPRTPVARLRLAWLILVAGVGSLAFAARLVPVLRGGGLHGLGNYDDGVYYAAGTALAHGLLPYRDFLLLHPPGVVVALAPFGLLGRLTDDPTGFAAARLAWMVLGAINAVLVARIVWPLGLVPAALGGGLYALFYPAIYTEMTTLLVAPAQTCVLLAVLLLSAGPTRGPRGARTAVAAGLLLGASTTFKIWGVVAVAAVAGWLALSGCAPRALRVLVGAALGTTLVCLPFFLAAPSGMWRMVVLYQLSRNPADIPVATKLAGIAGLGLHRPAIASMTMLLAVVLVVMLALLVAASWTAPGRLGVALTAALTALLLLSPSWFTHYPGVVSGPLAVALACGAGQVLNAARPRRPLHILLAGVLGLAVVAQAYPQRNLDLLHRFPAAALAGEVAKVDGCVSVDDPAALAQLDVLSRNLDRGCPFVADLGGYSYQFMYERGHWIPRRRDPAWQEAYLTYLRSGSVAMSWRYRRSGVLSPQTEATIQGWPRRVRVRQFVLREPQ